MKDNLKKPCVECPFRKTSLPGWLGGETAEDTQNAVLNEANFACHMTRHKKPEQMSRCKGSQIFLNIHCKVPKFNLPLLKALRQTRTEGHNQKEYLGFDFLEHHNKPSFINNNK